ncbi:MAG: MoaE-MoaD fusion protein [Thermoanaerobaculia bacterium]|jgi:molybdopterin converting factor subunit 1|nr:MoaE-MoaD fusion protein [Thermoanaerobaculia bacterium]
MLRVRLLFFAVLREIAGKDEEVVEIADGTTAGDVWQRLRREHTALRDYSQPPMIAVNESYARAEEILRDGDELVFIPPVAGG